MHATIWKVLAACMIMAAWNAAAEPKVTQEPVLDSDKPDAAAKQVFLPVLEDGPGKGFYIYYDRPKFLLTIARDGITVLTLKNADGTLLGDTRLEFKTEIHTLWNKPYNYNAQGKVDHKQIRRLPLVFKPEVKPATYRPDSKLLIKAKLMDNVEFHRFLSFNGDEFEVLSGFDCKNTDYKSFLHSSVNIPTTKTFEENVGLEDRKAALKGWVTKFVGPRVGKKKDYAFWESEELPVWAKNIDIKGPWGPRTVSIQGKEDDLSPRIYPGNPLHQGYTIYIWSFQNQSTNAGKYRGFKIKVN